MNPPLDAATTAADAATTAADAATTTADAAPSSEVRTGGGWQARLALTFAFAHERSTLVRREHKGPLVVQKPLYPEGDGVCQCIVVHPPGGIAGGDDLRLDVAVGAGAHAQLTTPGAAKWYRAGGRPAHQRALFSVGAAATLEWMPQGTIVFDGAQASSHLQVDLAADATFIGWDVVCLGRTAASEQFAEGAWRQRVDVQREGALLWSERAIVRGGSSVLRSRTGLYGAPVFGTFVAMGRGIDDNVLAACRAALPGRGEGAVTRLPDALVARYRGDASEAGHAYFGHLWSLVRPALLGRAAVPPRIWRT